MPTALIVQVADAVASELNAATLSQPFDAVRSYAPSIARQDQDVDELATLQVRVAPREMPIRTLTRARRDFDPTVDVAVLKRLASIDNGEVDPLMLLVEEIVDLFGVGHKLDLGPYGDDPATLVEIANPVIYGYEELRQHSVFASFVRLTFRKDR